MKSTVQLVRGTIVALALLLTLGIPTASADGPTPTPALPVAVTGAVGSSPSAAGVFGTTITTLAAHTYEWFRFEYNTGDSVPHPTVIVRLLNGVSNGMAFEVWSPDRMQGNWQDNQPVGRGTQQILPQCEPVEPTDTTTSEESPVASKAPATATSDATSLNCGMFVTNDLTWSGGFGGNGTYYVRLVNPTNAPIIPQLLIGGAGLRECVNANMGLPALGHVPSPDEPFAEVQCLDVGPGLVAGEAEGGQASEEE